MSGVNKVIIIGNLGDHPEVKYMPTGDAVTTISIATSKSWKDKNTGEKQERTEWHRIVLYRRLAEVAGEYLTKGSKCYIHGELRTRSWEDKDGVKKYTTEIISNDMQMLYKKSDSDGSSAPSTSSRKTPINKDGVDFDDDIPF